MRTEWLLLCVLLSSLLPNSANAEVSGTTGEEAALAQLNSTSESQIVLHLDLDTYEEAKQLASLQGIDTRRLQSINWSGGPMGSNRFGVE